MLKNSYDELVDSRRETILAFLKTHGHASLGEIAAHLEVSKQGALRHLEALEAAGLATVASAAPHGRGRPENVYQLTAAAGEHFPDRHRELTGELVELVSDDQLKRFFELRAARPRAGQARHRAWSHGRGGGADGRWARNSPLQLPHPGRRRPHGPALCE